MLGLVSEARFPADFPLSHSIDPLIASAPPGTAGFRAALLAGCFEAPGANQAVGLSSFGDQFWWFNGICYRI